MKKITCLIVLLFTISSCGTDYFYSSFTIRRELLWFTSLADQETLDTHAQMVGYTPTLNRYSSPSIIATPANYLVAIYENRNISSPDLDIYGIDRDRGKKAEVTARISKNSSNFDNTVTVGNIKNLNPSSAHGSPVSFLTKEGNIVVLSTAGVGFAKDGVITNKTKIAVSISTNNGYDWTDWKDLDETVFESLKAYNRFYTTPGNGKTLRNGTLVCMIDYKTNYKEKAKGAAILYSTDNGTTWKIGGTLTYNGNTHRFAKIIAERTDGKLLIAAVPYTGTNNNDAYQKTGSIAWYLADDLNSPINTFNVTGPEIIDANLGRVVKVFEENSGGVISGDRIKYAYKGRAYDGILLAHSYPERKFQHQSGPAKVSNVTAISISGDDGKTWTMITNVVGKDESTNQAAFRHSGLAVFKDGSIGLAYEEGVGPSINDQQGFIPYYRRFGLSAISGGVYSYEGL